MLNLIGNTDKLSLITSAAATIDVVAAFMDISGAVPPVIQGDTSGNQLTAITTANTTDIVATPASTEIRNVKTLHIRNKHASLSCDVTVQLNRSGTLYELHKCTLVAGASLEYIEGIGFFVLSNGVDVSPRVNESVSSQTGFAADTYLVGSSLAVPVGWPIVGSAYKLVFDVTKTAAGTGTPTITIRYGINGTIADTSRCSFVFGAGTAAVDVGRFEVLCDFRTVGSAGAAVIQGLASLTSNLTVTGISNAVKAVLNTGGGFDSTVASSFIGASYNGGASAAHTIQLVRAELVY